MLFNGYDLKHFNQANMVKQKLFGVKYGISRGCQMRIFMSTIYMPLNLYLADISSCSCRYIQGQTDRQTEKKIDQKSLGISVLFSGSTGVDLTETRQ